MKYYRAHVFAGVDPVCMKNGTHDVMDALPDAMVAHGLTDGGSGA